MATVTVGTTGRHIRIIVVGRPGLWVSVWDRDIREWWITPAGETISMSGWNDGVPPR
jgi:hypothetical protein